ncbi:hypothetical protein [Streptomyces sp. NPDC048603]|uniref:hypothetical protein n=1 Tax=Streptomyces sp. NPDC048603 TaxID=3365577 RepID=UPI00371BDDCC
MREYGAAVAVVVTIAASGSGAMVSPAVAASSVFDFQVDPPNAPDVYKDVPGTEVVFDAAAGEKSYLWSRRLSAVPVTELKAGENIGVTFAVRCQYANGQSLPQGTESGAYWAANLVPPGESALNPGLRWLFQAPTSGTYRCRLSVVGYSSVVNPGRQVTMRVPAGAELGILPMAVATRWTLPDASATTVARGTTATTLGYTYVPAAGGRTTIVQDANLTTCVAGSRICGGGTDAYSGTTAETWIEAQPQQPDGTPCGGPVKGPVAKWKISDAKHHQSATNTLNLTSDQLGGCTRIRATLKVRNVDGNPVRIHAGHASEGIAATHGLAYTL